MMDFQYDDKLTRACADALLSGALLEKADPAMRELIHRAYREGYDLGKHEAEENIEGRLDAAFDRGYTARLPSDDEWDEGYLAGVADARVRPSEADDVVQYILAARAKHALNGEYDASLVSDTGDVCEQCKQPGCRNTPVRNP